MDNNYFILDLLYSINDSDYYMKAITVGGDEKKIKLTKKQFLNWCKGYEEDEEDKFRMIGGEIRLIKPGKNEYSWLEISKDTLEEHFKLVNV